MPGSQTPREKLSAAAPAKCPDSNNTRTCGRLRTRVQSVRCLHQPEVPPSLSPLPHPKDQGDDMSQALIPIVTPQEMRTGFEASERVLHGISVVPFQTTYRHISGHCCLVIYQPGTIEALHPACTPVSRGRRRQRDSFVGDQQNGGVK